MTNTSRCSFHDVCCGPPEVNIIQLQQLASILSQYTGRRPLSRFIAL